MPLKVVETEDGTITCFDPATGELYHNKAGAYAEALANFIEPSGLLNKAANLQAVSVLDLPFGLGYNTFVLLKLIGRLPVDRKLRQLNITFVEIDPEVMTLLPRVLADDCFASLRKDLPNWQDILTELAKFESVEFKMQNFLVSCHCRQGDIRKEIPALAGSGIKYDAILHDPFSPKQMPELWTLDLFQMYRELLGDDGRMLTYSAATAVRGALRLAGFTVYRTVALGGKSGGTLASACPIASLPDSIFPLSKVEESRLLTSAAIPYRDPMLSDSRSQIWRRRQSECHMMAEEAQRSRG